MLSLKLFTSNFKSRRTLFLSYLKLEEKNKYYLLNSNSASRNSSSCTFAKMFNYRYRNNYYFAIATYYCRLEVLDVTLDIYYNKLSFLYKISSYILVVYNNKILSF